MRPKRLCFTLPDLSSQCGRSIAVASTSAAAVGRVGAREASYSSLRPSGSARTDSTRRSTSQSGSGGENLVALMPRSASAISAGSIRFARMDAPWRNSVSLRPPLPTFSGNVKRWPMPTPLGRTDSTKAETNANGAGSTSSGGTSHSYLRPLGWTEGGATMYEPSPRTSTASSELTLGRTSCDALNSRCVPPLPVIAVAVSGSSPCSRSHSRRASCPSGPSSCVSRSTTTSPRDGAPHTMPMFASGYRVHIALTLSASSVQSFRPCFVIGSFALGFSGTTANPRFT